MFSLIIVLISIVLVAVLALATFYYLSDTVTEKTTQAQAVTARNQAEQIAGAMQLYRSDRSAWPTDLAELVAEGYLRDVPLAPPALAMTPSVLDGIVAPAFAQAAPQWAMPVANKPYFWLYKTVNPRACGELNFSLQGENAVRRRLNPNLGEQCFGTAQPFTYLFALEQVDLPVDAESFPVAGGDVIEVLAAGQTNEVVVAASRVAQAGSGGTEGAGAGGGGGSGSGAGIVSPPAAALGNIEIGSSVLRSFTITNTSASNSIALGVPSYSAPMLTTHASSTCGATLAASGSCSWVIQAAPSSVGAFGVTASRSAGTSNLQVSLSGYGVAAPPVGSNTFSVSPSLVSLGNVLVGAQASQTVTVTNTGSGPMTFAAAATTGSGFTISDLCAAQQVQGGASCQIVVNAAPSAAGAIDGSISISAATGSAPSTTVTVAGTASLASFSVGNTAALAFGNVAQGSTSSVALTVTNTSSGPVVFAPPVASGSGFGVISSSCANATVAAAGTCDIQVGANTSTVGNITGTLTVSTSVNYGQVQLSYPVSGSIVPLAFTTDVSSVSFGTVARNGTYTRTVNVSNTGGAPITFAASSLSNASDMTLTDGCSGLTLATAGQGTNSCQLTLTWSPSAAGNLTSAVLTVNPTTPGVTASSLSVTGSAQNSTFGVTAPSGGQFLNVKAGEPKDMVLTVTNTSSTPLSNITASVSNMEQNAVAVHTNACVGQTLSQNQTCTITLRATPNAVGMFSANALVNATGATQQQVGVYGTAKVDYSLEITPTTSTVGYSATGLMNSGQYNFGTVQINTQTDVTFTVTNTTGTAQIASSGGVTISGSAPYTVVPESSTCPGATLTQNQSCTVTVRLAPTVATAPSSVGAANLNINVTRPYGVTLNYLSLAAVASSGPTDPLWGSVQSLLPLSASATTDAKGLASWSSSAAALVSRTGPFGSTTNVLDLSANTSVTSAAGGSTSATTKTTTSIYSGSRYLTAGAAPFALAANDNYTYEAWIYPTALPSSAGQTAPIIAQTNWNAFHRPDGNVTLLINYNSGSPKLCMYKMHQADGVDWASTNLCSSVAISANTWTHVAGVRSGTNYYLFVNGALVGTASGAASATQGTGATSIAIGAHNWFGTSAAAGQKAFVGYMSNIRITKAARYTANFSVPTAPFPTQ